MNNNEYVLLMKQTIDDSVRGDKKIQKFLTWLYKKTSSLKSSYQESALRAFYCDVVEGITSAHYATASEGSSVTVNRKISRLLDSNLDKDIDEARGVGVKLRKSAYDGIVGLYPIELSEFDFRQLIYQAKTLPAINVAFDKDVAIACKMIYSYETFNKHHDSSLFHKGAYLGRAIALLVRSSDFEFKQQLVYFIDSFPNARDFAEYWYEIYLKEWRQRLSSCLSRYRNLKLDWQFSDEQKQLLDKYYEANQLLLDCLEASNASPEVTKEIQDSLLLPTVELERRKTRKQ